MSYIPKTVSEVITEYINRTTFFPAIQREYVWDTYAIEKLFDSILGDFPIGTFLISEIFQSGIEKRSAYTLSLNEIKNDNLNIRKINA